eukprot:gene15719-21278_t
MSNTSTKDNENDCEDVVSMKSSSTSSKTSRLSNPMQIDEREENMIASSANEEINRNASQWIMSWNNIYKRFEEIYTEEFSVSKKAHLDCLPKEESVVDGAKVKWCALILLDAIVYILQFNQFDHAKRRSFNQQRVLFDCIFQELKETNLELFNTIIQNKRLLFITPIATVGSNENIYRLDSESTKGLSNAFSVGVKLNERTEIVVNDVHHPWNNLEVMRSLLMSDPPSKSKKKYFQTIQVLCDHQALRDINFDLPHAIQIVVQKLLYGEFRPPTSNQLDIMERGDDQNFMAIKKTSSKDSQDTDVGKLSSFSSQSNSTSGLPLIDTWVGNSAMNSIRSPSNLILNSPTFSSSSTLNYTNNSFTGTTSTSVDSSTSSFTAHHSIHLPNRSGSITQNSLVLPLSTHDSSLPSPTIAKLSSRPATDKPSTLQKLFLSGQFNQGSFSSLSNSAKEKTSSITWNNSIEDLHSESNKSVHFSVNNFPQPYSGNSSIIINDSNRINNINNNLNSNSNNNSSNNINNIKNNNNNNNNNNINNNSSSSSNFNQQQEQQQQVPFSELLLNAAEWIDSGGRCSIIEIEGSGLNTNIRKENDDEDEIQKQKKSI